MRTNSLSNWSYRVVTLKGECLIVDARQLRMETVNDEVAALNKAI